MGYKILIVEDDVECIKLIETILEHEGYNTVFVTTGREGLKTAYELHPDLIILDVMLPDIDGFEVCTRLRELSDVPILMLTARGAQNDLLRGFSAGADDYVRKPFSREELVARLGALLRRHQMHNGSHHIITHYTDGILDARRAKCFLPRPKYLSHPHRISHPGCVSFSQTSYFVTNIGLASMGKWLRP